MKMQTAKLTRKYFSGAGRPRRPDAPRSECGRIVKAHRAPVETQEQVLATTLAQPHRKAAPEPRSVLLGYALGRLFFAKIITGDQHNAGERYTRLAVKHMRDVTDAPMPTFPSFIAERIAREFDNEPELTPEQQEREDDDILALRRAWADAMNALAGTGEMHDCIRVLASVCIMDRDIVDDRALGTMRVAHNALHRLWS